MCGFGGKLVCFSAYNLSQSFNYYLDICHIRERKRRQMIKERWAPSFGLTVRLKIESPFVITEMNSKHTQVYLHTHYQAWNNCNINIHAILSRPDFSTSSVKKYPAKFCPYTRFQIVCRYKNVHSGKRIQKVANSQANLLDTCGRKTNPERRSCGLK